MKNLFFGTLIATALVSISAQAVTYKFVVPLDGAQESPGPGDPDGTGLATLYIDSVTLSIEWDISVSNILLPVAAAHIHNAPAGVAGPVRVDFSGQLSGIGLFDPDLAGVLADPTSWYVNVHNSQFPAGAVRGQLSAPVSASVPEGSPGLIGFAVVGIALASGMRMQARRKTVSA